jgi:fermentation-respiration switch protein FrsA (DUF1100 family)
MPLRVPIRWTISILAIFLLMGGLLHTFQTSMIFYPGKLRKDFRFSLVEGAEEVFLNTTDGETINALFYPGTSSEVILYFHGNAGDLSGWQHISQDFTRLGYSILIIDYRGYGKSSGTITEQGLYKDGEAAYQFLVNEKGYAPEDIIIYGRSIGTGIAVELAARHETKGIILESPFTSLKKLANQKVPFLLPSLFLKYSFDNIGKINSLNSPVLFIHGAKDSLIPVSHTEKLFTAFHGEKEKIIIPGGGHNDLNTFSEYHEALLNAVDLFRSDGH